MKPISLPVLPFLLMFILGVHFAFQVEMVYKGIDGVLALLLLVYFSLHPPLKWWNFIFGCCFFWLGFFAGKIDQNFPESHYSQKLEGNGLHHFDVELTQQLSSSTHRSRYYAKIYRIDNRPSSGTILLSIDQTNEKAYLHHNNRWIIQGQLHPIQAPLNPGEFNYKDYLLSIGIIHQLNTTSSRISPGKSIPFSFQKYRAFIREKIKNSGLNPLSISIIETMLLGERSSLDRDIKTLFSKAGVIHLFAISGLHVGLLMLLFREIFRPLLYLPHGKLWQSCCVLGCLWSYAFLVGGAPSVIRAVTLFSAYQIGQNSKRKLPATYFVLLSMGILIFIHPRFVLQLGFQMSYLAVFGILFITPLIQVKFKYNILNWFWQLTTVSLAAQIAVAPLSTYHFHQFPGLFLLSNWVILPFVGVFLYLSVGVIFILLFFPLPQWIVFVEDRAIRAMLQFVEWVAAKEAFLFTDLYYNRLSLYLLYLCLITLVIFAKTKKRSWGYITSAGIVVLVGVVFSASPSQLWIAHHYKQSVIVHQEKGELQFYFSDSLSPQAPLVKDYSAVLPHHNIIFLPLKNTYAFLGKSLVIIDGPWVFEWTNFH